MLLLGALSSRAAAQEDAGVAPASSEPAYLTVNFMPVDRTQIAVWVERDDGEFMGTLALTHSVARAGIGNRPGALQMNSGFRWPYGRREGALPVWAHRRAAAPGAKQFRRVIFQDRMSEGFASRTSSDQSVDDYYCLSFQESNSGRDALDAVTCASVFSSDKGRFITEADRGYSEPYEDSPGNGTMRALGLTSLYPPRRDVDRCAASGCFDHADVATYKSHALEVMPELDAVTQATPQGQRMVEWSFSLAENSRIAWDSARMYTLFIEVNVEGDYNDTFNDKRFPTPITPKSRWDTWAIGYGYAYRGQPSVVYALPFGLTETQDVWTAEPVGYSDVHGAQDQMNQMDGTLTDDPEQAPGSGADRLRMMNGKRAMLRITRCDGAEVPPPAPPTNLRVEPHPDRKNAHMWARLSFRTPATGEVPVQYDVKVRAEGGDWEQAFTPDKEQELLSVALDVCADPNDPMRNRCGTIAPGSELTVDISGLRQSTRYDISVSSRGAACGGTSDPVLAEYTTPKREFTTVSPCFVATAAYGTPLASEIGVLRRFRDRYLATNTLGRVLIDAYYAVGPGLADFVRQHEWARSAARHALDPVVAIVSWWMQ
ncbi:MAG: hypothetical protein QM778_23830 [Myxococcales bacterium]